MTGSRKGVDLARDGRVALHTASEDPPKDDPSAWSGDAKVSGRAGGAHRDHRRGADGEGSRADIAEVVRSRVEGDELVVELRRPGRPLRRVRRK